MEKNNPPITVRAKGVRSSEPSPIPSARGSIPIIVVKEVIRMGRRRTAEACAAALCRE